jgi:tight adherence protein B
VLTTVIAICVGVGVAALIGAGIFAFRGETNAVLEARLSNLTDFNRGGTAERVETNIIRGSLQSSTSDFEHWLSSKFNFRGLLDLADSKLSIEKFALICLACGGVTAIAFLFSPLPKLCAPIAGALTMYLPILWMKFRGKKRMSKFNAQLPEALEMLSRSLRAGHSLGAGFGLISQEMAAPLAREFGRCFEEQNLGVSLEQSLESMARRIPNLDLRFFATAVILQRQTGGDLAEILEKIGRLIRARFRLAGQIQALTGEGRLSGIVLLALPPGLFCMMLFVNREYVMKLFTDPMGQWMLGGAIVMQLAGAWTIKKIIDIKV